MTDFVVNLLEETYRALKVRAAGNGRSMEAEIRQIMEEVLSPVARVRIGSELAAFGRRFGGFALDVGRDKDPIEQATFD